MTMELRFGENGGFAFGRGGWARARRCVVAVLVVAGLVVWAAPARAATADTAYVANSGSDSVTPIDTATNTADPAIAVGDYPIAVAITPDGKTAYVVNYSSNSVTPIDTATDTAGRRSRSAPARSRSRSPRTAGRRTSSIRTRIR